MGRWFGYRPGYVDCCKIFTTFEAIEKFDATTRTIEELEAEFMKMDREGKTPRHFILRVKKDPGALKITRPSILKNTAKVNWSYQDKLEQTTKFHLHPHRIENAWTGFKAFVKEHQPEFIFDEERGFHVLHTSPAKIFQLLALENSFYNYSSDLNQIKIFIEKCLEKDKLTSWTIALKARGNARKIKNVDKDFPFPLQMTQRRGPKQDQESPYRRDFITRHKFAVSGGSANIVSAGTDLAILLSKPEKDDAEKEFTEERIAALVKKQKTDEKTARQQVNDKPVTFPERIYRERISDQHGLLLIYLQDLQYVFRQDDKDPALAEMAEKEGFNLNIPLIGFAFGFPPIDPDPGGEYLINKYWDEEEEEEEEFDDELQSEDSWT